MLISGLNIIPYSGDLKDDSKDQNFEIIDDSDARSDIEPKDPHYGSRGTPSTIGLIEKNNHGGSWLDSFEDDSGIEWGKSNDLKISNGSVQINTSLEGPFTVDTKTVGLWHFDEGTGSTTYDETINDNDGSKSGATWTTGKFGNALNYNGGSDNVRVNDDNTLDFTSSESFTLEAWVKTSGIRSNILCKYVEGVSAYYQLWIPLGGYARFALRCSNNINIGIDSVTKINDNKWHYIAGVRDTNLDKLLIYFDGKLENSVTDTTTGSISTSGPLKFGKYVGGSALNFNGIIDEVRISDKARSATEIGNKRGNVNKWANLTSKTIDLPAKMAWDTLIINKTQPSGTYLNVTILNASNNQKIPGSPNYTADGEFNISYIDPIKYPSIKLNATFCAYNITTPILHYWGVDWNASNMWRDTFYGGLKRNSTNLTYSDGEIYLNNSTIDRYEFSGNITSEKIILLSSSQHEILIINKTEPASTYINVTIVDGSTLQPITNFENLTGWAINISSINRILHPRIMLNATFESNGFATPTLYDWSIGTNTAPKIVKVSSDPIANRTHSEIIKIDLYDGEEQKRDLNLTVEYKSPSDTNWQTAYLNDPTFITDQWVSTFTPPAIAELGNYTFRFICNDSLNRSDIYTPYNITVVNNHPVTKIFPSSSLIFRTNILNIVINATDAEIQAKDLNITIQYKSPIDVLWQTALLSGFRYSNGNWLVNFTTYKNTYPGWYVFNVTINDSIIDIINNFNVSVRNNYPIIWSVNSSPTTNDINRTRTLKMFINATDIENSTGDLNVTIEYKSPFDVVWQMGYLSSLIYNSTTGLWDAEFSPPKNADIGRYTIKTSCQDNDSAIVYKNISINVLNNLPEIGFIKTNTSKVQLYRTKSIKLIINTSDIENLSDELNVIVKYKSPLDIIWKTTFLTNFVYNNGNWEIDFNPPRFADVGLYTFNVSCEDKDSAIVFDEIDIEVRNYIPVIGFIKTNITSIQVNRTRSIKLIINVTDLEESTEDLNLIIKYKSPLDTTWKTEYITDIHFNNSNWEANFTPEKNAELGWYTFNISCEDGNTGIAYDTLKLVVLNNKPKILDIDLSNTQVNRTFSINVEIDLFDTEINKDGLDIKIEYRSPFDMQWRSEYISGNGYQNGKWLFTFTPDKKADMGSYYFIVTCNDTLCDVNDTFSIEVVNNLPIIHNFILQAYEVKRTNPLKINIDASDVELLNDELDIEIEYKSPIDIKWQNQYISNKIFLNDHWEVQFIPPKNAPLGNYLFNIICNDSDTQVFCPFQVLILNNIPFSPTVSILPSKPKSTDDLEIMTSKPKDVETSEKQMEYWYYWYKDEEHMPEFDNQTTIPNSATEKGETWQCDVYPFDGDGVGPYGTAEVTILNSPPELVEQFNSYEIFEDMPAILENKLTTIFNDPDSDVLTFSVIGQNNIDIEIMPENGTIKLTPAMDWYGSEYITFYAKDNSMAMVEESVLVTVTPTNDLPRIVQIGTQLITDDLFKLEFIVKQDEWLNLTIKVQDIDGDVEHGTIQYILNISERNNLYFTKNDNKLVFNPTNADVGSHYLTIMIADNNETPAIYISQDINIEVLNVNEPPTVEIITPDNGVVFTDPKMLSFSCAADDIDLLIPNPTEELTYKWITNRSEYRLIGTGKELILVNQTLLKPGYYEITVVVTDRAGDIAYDSIKIIIEKTESESKPDGSLFSNYSFLGLIIIVMIIIFIIAILMFIVIRKKKKERAARALGLSGEQVLQPVEVYQPYQTPTIGTSTIAPGPQISPSHLVQSEPLAPAPIQELLGPIPTAAPTTQPTAQLPPATPTITVPIPVPTPIQAGTGSELTPQQKLKLLEDRLICGEIDQDIYLNLKAKLDLEAKPYQPPQLPPSTTLPPTETAPILTTPAPFTPQQQQPEQPSQIPIQSQQETTIEDAQPQQPLGPPQTPLEPQVQAQAQPQVQQQEPQPEIQQLQATPPSPQPQVTVTPQPQTQTQLQQQQQTQIKPGSEEEQ